MGLAKPGTEPSASSSRPGWQPQPSSALPGPRYLLTALQQDPPYPEAHDRIPPSFCRLLMPPRDAKPARQSCADLGLEPPPLEPTFTFSNRDPMLKLDWAWTELDRRSAANTAKAATAMVEDLIFIIIVLVIVVVVVVVVREASVGFVWASPQGEKQVGWCGAHAQGQISSNQGGAFTHDFYGKNHLQKVKIAAKNL